MNRRAFMSVSATLATTAFAGCASSDQNGGQASGSESGTQSTDEDGPVGPEGAVKHYDNAVELLDKNADELNDVRQQFILADDNIDFSVTTITSRTDEAREQLGLAAEEDDGSLTEEIETLRRVASYQDALVQYNEEYLELDRLNSTGLDHYFEGRYQSAIETLRSAHQQIESVRSSLDDVDEELDAVLDAADSATVDDRFRERMLMASDDHAEIHEELDWLDRVLLARIDEVQGEKAFSSGNAAFEDERYGTARSQYSDAENHLVSAETQLENLDIEEDTEYLTSLVNDSDSLECEYGFVASAADELAQASQAMQNGNRSQANRHLEQANTHFSMSGTC